MDVRAKKSWTSAPKSAFSCSPGGGEKLFDPWASGRQGQECPREIRTKSLCLCCFSSLTESLSLHSSSPSAPSNRDSQSLANFVANCHSQGISAARTKFSQSHSQSRSQLLSRCLIRNFFFGIRWPKFASTVLQRVGIFIRIRSRIGATAVQSGPLFRKRPSVPIIFGVPNFCALPPPLVP